MAEVKIPVIDDIRRDLLQHLRKNPYPLKKAKQINHKHHVDLKHGHDITPVPTLIVQLLSVPFKPKFLRGAQELRIRGN